MKNWTRGLLRKRRMKEGTKKMEPSHLKVRRKPSGRSGRWKQECKEEDREKDWRRWNRHTQMEPGVAWKNNKERRIKGR
jgi:hypothetical protein